MADFNYQAARHFFANIRKMREEQQSYFKFRDAKSLAEAKRLEKIIDSQHKRIEEMIFQHIAFIKGMHEGGLSGLNEVCERLKEYPKEGTTYGDTQLDATAVAHGINITVEHLQTVIKRMKG